VTKLGMFAGKEDPHRQYLFYLQPMIVCIVRLVSKDLLYNLKTGNTCKELYLASMEVTSVVQGAAS
jgi:hypothetical protein